MRKKLFTNNVNLKTRSKMEEDLNNLCLIKIIPFIAKELFFDSDTEDEEDSEIEDLPIAKKPKLESEQNIPRPVDPAFQVQFRLKKENFEKLCTLIQKEHNDCSDVYSGQLEIPFDKQLLITLWFLGNIESFQSVADRFEIFSITCWSVVENICNFLLKINKRHKIINWPTKEDAESTASYFQQRTRFPGVIGCIDNTHILICKPKLFPDLYVNDEKRHSIRLQVVCNEKLLFMDCYTGEAGSISNERLFDRSNLSEKIHNGTFSIPIDQHLLGDQSYSLNPKILTPFDETETLDDMQKKYNKVHSNIRETSKIAIGLLKARFRRLQQLNTKTVEFNPLFTMSCCVLHNYCIRNNDFIDKVKNPFESFTHQKSLDSDESLEQIAQRKRMYISHVL